MSSPKRIEVVTVCCGYGDILAQSAKHHQGLFDRHIIVTTEDDLETRETARKYSLETLFTEDGRSSGGFAKGKMIERGLQHLSAGDVWYLHLDADIVLPSKTRQLLDAAQLQKDVIYGCDRAMCRNWDEWKALEDSGYLQHQHDYHYRIRFPVLNGQQLPIGTRWVGLQHGYVPIGFFQLSHADNDLWRGIRPRPYPSTHNSACRSDVQRGLQFDRHKRELLPELIAIHLESEPSPLGVNWEGRKSKRFGPETRFKEDFY